MFNWLYRLIGLPTVNELVETERRQAELRKISKDRADLSQSRRERLRSHFAESHDSGSIHTILSTYTPPSNCDKPPPGGSCSSNSCRSHNSCSGASSCSTSSSSCGGGGGGD